MSQEWYSNLAETEKHMKPTGKVAAWAVAKTVVKSPVAFFSLLQKVLFLRRRSVAWHLRNLVVYGGDGDRVVFDHRGSERFLQARKYVNDVDEYGVDLVIPLTPEALGGRTVTVDNLEDLGFVTKRIEINPDFSVLFADIGSDPDTYETAVSKVLDVLGFTPWSVFSLGLGRLYHLGKGDPVFGNTGLKGGRYTMG